MNELGKYYDKKKGTFILPDGTETDAYTPVYKAPLGDLIEDFIDNADYHYSDHGDQV